MMKRTALLFCAAAACTETLDPDLATVEEETVFDQGYLWTKDDLTVCWEDSAYDDPLTPDEIDDVNLNERRWVKDIVQANWGRHSRLELDGWGRCATTTNPDIRIANGITSQPFSHIGTTSVGQSPSMLLNLKCSVPAECIPREGEPPPDDGNVLAMCNGWLVNGEPPPNKKVCLETVALHEFGHALGLRHEQAHPDETCAQFSEPLDVIEDGVVHDGEAIGPYDAQSIMNYCASGPMMRGTTTPSISSGDIIGANTLYSNPPMFYTATSLGGTTSPLVVGPGTFTVTGTTLGATRSLHSTAGYVVTLCNGGGCFTPPAGVTAALPRWLSAQVQTITVKTQAVGYVDVGFRGQSAVYPPGKYMALNGTLRLPNDQLSSLFTPHGQKMRICRHEGWSPTYAGYECTSFAGSPSTDHAPAVTVPAYYDQNTSFIEVTSFVQFYDGASFRGNDKTGYAPGTYKVSTGANFTNVRSWLVPQDLELTVCTGEGTGSGTGCQIVKSGDVTAALFNQVKLIKVRLVPTAVPPCTGC